MVTPVRDGAVPIAETHKDGAHGNIPMWALSPTTRFPNRLIAGRDLTVDDAYAVVVGRSTLDELQTAIGGTVAPPVPPTGMRT